MTIFISPSVVINREFGRYVISSSSINLKLGRLLH